MGRELKKTCVRVVYIMASPSDWLLFTGAALAFLVQAPEPNVAKMYTWRRQRVSTAASRFPIQTSIPRAMIDWGSPDRSSALGLAASEGSAAKTQSNNLISSVGQIESQRIEIS